VVKEAINALHVRQLVAIPDAYAMASVSQKFDKAFACVPSTSHKTHQNLVWVSLRFA
jgi:hypothetical protein